MRTFVDRLLRQLLYERQEALPCQSQAVGPPTPAQRRTGKGWSQAKSWSTALVQKRKLRVVNQ